MDSTQPSVESQSGEEKHQWVEQIDSDLVLSQTRLLAKVDHFLIVLFEEHINLRLVTNQ